MKIVTVNEQYQQGYSYELKEPIGKNFDPQFKPELTPEEMFKAGIFGGNYFQAVPSEFPASWFRGVAFSRSGGADPQLNFYKVNASQPLRAWQQKGWIYPEDPKGWVLWYCRYYMGRRLPEEDARQIKRWRAMRRHIVQIQKHCRPRDTNCRRKQRQALLHWAYDSRKL